MMNIYKSYEIDLSNIWKYEKSQFLKGNTTEYHSKKVIDKIQPLIVRFSDKLSEEGGLATSYFMKYLPATVKGLKGKYEVDIFIYNKGYYKYDNVILIDRMIESFEFWFSLKLRQYISAKAYTHSFLDFQLSENFDNNIDSFIPFLNKNILKYKDELYSTEVVDTVKQWVSINTKKKVVEGITEIVKENISGSSITLKIYPDFQKTVFKVLQPFFDKQDLELLLELIQGKSIKEKLYFQTNANRFCMVFRQLHLHQKIIGQYIETEQWICAYFDYKNLKKGRVNFAQSDVHKILTNESYDIPKAKRIDIPNLDFIKDKSKNQ